MYAKVISRGKIRKGRGFSIEELKKAKFDLKDAKKIVKIDKRRKTCYDFNVEILKKIKSKIKEEKKEEIIPLTAIKGIGKKREEIFKSIGIKSVNDLAKADVDEISNKTNISRKILEKYIKEAKEYVSGKKRNNK